MKKLNYAIAVVAILLISLVIGEAQITIPNSFTSGTTISSSQMNSNFTALGAAALNRTAGTMTGTLTTVGVLPAANNTYDIGSSGVKYKNGFFAGTLTTGPISATTGTFSGAVTGTFTGSGTSLTGVNLYGKQTLWIPATAMSPTITNGATGPTVTELTAGQPNITVLSFPNGSNKNAQFAIAMPKSWNAGTITFQAFWTGTSAGAGTSIWGLQCLGVADNVTTDAAFGTAVEVTDTFLTVKFVHVAAESSAVTISGAAADTYTTCQVYRKGASDTRAAASLLLGIKLFYTTNAANDL